MKRILLLILSSGFAMASSVRIVTLSPALTELFIQLGKKENIVGASNYSDYPAEAKSIPRVGELFFPSLEKILKLEVSHLIVDGMTVNSQFVSAAKALKLPLMIFQIQTVQSLLEQTKDSLRVLFHEDTNATLENAEAHIQKWKNNHKNFTFLFLTWVKPTIVATRTSFFSNIFELRGGTNLISSEIRAPYIQVSSEWLIQNKPDYVLILEDEHFDKGDAQAWLKQNWGEQLPKTIRLPSKEFARTSLSPIFYLPTLMENQ